MSLSTGPKFYPMLDCDVRIFSLHFIIRLSVEFFKVSRVYSLVVESVCVRVYILSMFSTRENIDSTIKYINFGILLLIANFLEFSWFK